MQFFYQVRYVFKNDVESSKYEYSAIKEQVVRASTVTRAISALKNELGDAVAENGGINVLEVKVVA